MAQPKPKDAFEAGYRHELSARAEKGDRVEQYWCGLGPAFEENFIAGACKAMADCDMNFALSAEGSR